MARKKINTPERFREAVEALGNPSNQALGEALRMSEDQGRAAIRRYKAGTNMRGIPGPVQIAMEALVSGFRPLGVTFPCDEAKANG